jgi:hypothetical protein
VNGFQGDLLADTGVDAPVDGVEGIVPCASHGTRVGDVTSAQNLSTAARRGPRRAHHLPVDRQHQPDSVAVLQTKLRDYQTKLCVERALDASGVACPSLPAAAVSPSFRCRSRGA